MDYRAIKVDVTQTILKSVSYVALALWLGGLIAIGAIVAPIAFHLFRTDPLFHGQLDLQNSLAATIIGGSFRTFNRLCELCGALLTACVIGMTYTGGSAGLQKKIGLGTSFVCTALLISAVCLDFIVFPAMDAARAASNTPEFDQLHLLYVNLSNVQVFGLLVVAVALASLTSVSSAVAHSSRTD